MSRLLTLTGVAQYLGVTRPTAYKYVNTVGFPKPLHFPTAKGFARRWTADAIETWLVEGANTPERNQAATTAGQS